MEQVRCSGTDDFYNSWSRGHCSIGWSRISIGSYTIGWSRASIVHRSIGWSRGHRSISMGWSRGYCGNRSLQRTSWATMLDKAFVEEISTHLGHNIQSPWQQGARNSVPEQGAQSTDTQRQGKSTVPETVSQMKSLRYQAEKLVGE